MTPQRTPHDATPEERLGSVTEVPEGVQVQFRRSWPDPIQDVWAALTEPDRTRGGSAAMTASDASVARALSR